MIKYTNLDIPAKLFFQIMHSEEYDIIGGEEVYDKLFDEYYELDDNASLKDWMQKKDDVNRISLKIHVIESIIKLILASVNDTQLLMHIKALNDLEFIKRKFDINKGLVEEILRFEKSILGTLRNELNQLIDSEKVNKAAVKYHFEQDLVSIENVLERNIPTKLSTYKYVFLKKSAQRKIESLKKITQTNGKK